MTMWAACGCPVEEHMRGVRTNLLVAFCAVCSRQNTRAAVLNRCSALRSHTHAELGSRERSETTLGTTQAIGKRGSF